MGSHITPKAIPHEDIIAAAAADAFLWAYGQKIINVIKMMYTVVRKHNRCTRFRITRCTGQ